MIKSISLKLTLLFALLIPTFSFAETEKHSVSGYIKSSKDGESLIGAAVFVEELKTGATANVYGFYSLTLPT